MRARALDNQVYFAANSPARDENGPYVAYGNSCIASPWGDFIAHADEKESILYGDIDLDYEVLSRAAATAEAQKTGLY